MANIPQSCQEAVNSKDKEAWRKAMDKEMNTLRYSNTWSIQPLPEERTDTNGRWVYTLKQGKTPG